MLSNFVFPITIIIFNSLVTGSRIRDFATFHEGITHQFRILKAILQLEVCVYNQ